eukprot:765207-Hanusia_phi.AAC.1
MKFLSLLHSDFLAPIAPSLSLLWPQQSLIYLIVLVRFLSFRKLSVISVFPSFLSSPMIFYPILSSPVLSRPLPSCLPSDTAAFSCGQNNTTLPPLCKYPFPVMNAPLLYPTPHLPLIYPPIHQPV